MPEESLARFARVAERFGDLLSEASYEEPETIPAETWRRLSRLAAEVSALAEELAREADLDGAG